jgi:hypothetical protein
MAEATRIVEQYFAMWNEPDSARRRALIEQTWTADGRYVDPLQEAAGPEALSAMVAAVHTQYPGFRFRQVRGIDQHHDQLRFAWELVAPDGSTAAAGLDIAAVSADGRLRQVVGFLGELPEETAA